MLKILAWNVNGIRAVQKKGFVSWLLKESPDVLCVQEIKAMTDQLDMDLMNPLGYHTFWNSAKRPGYSGVAIFSKEEPLEVRKGFGMARFDDEGRVIQAKYKNFTVLNIYFPNGKMSPERLQYKMDFYDHILNYINALKKKEPNLIICGDYNTAHKAIDLAHPKQNEKVSGFLPIERDWMDKLSGFGYLDTFRLFNQNPEQYSWWDMRTGARERNIGWRIDYHFITPSLQPYLKKAFIQPDVMGSDHCPVGIELEFNGSHP